MDRLTNEVKQFSDSCKETEESKERRHDLRRRLKDMVNESRPGSDVVIVGSCGNGFGTKNSDLDLTIIDPPRSTFFFWSTNILMEIESCLKRNKSLYTDVEVVSRATVPIITFNYRCTVETIPCDVSVNKRNNIFNTVLLKAYSQLDDRVIPLQLALKKWAKKSRVIDSRNNRFASFTLSLMVIHYLQSGCNPSVLPSLQTRHSSFFRTSDQNVQDITRYIYDPLPQNILSFRSDNNKTIGELFLGFFDHYCYFNWAFNGISVRHGENIRRPLKRGSNNTYPYVEDPYQTGSNTARGVFKEEIWNDMIREFQSARYKLSNGRSFNDII